MTKKVRNAVLLGVMCAVAYLAVYLARNILSAVSPQMIELGVLSTEQVGALSSAFFVTYAIGQLINGTIGDKIKAKYMISFGLGLAGVCNVAFALFAHHPLAAYAAYGVTGFCLAMIYGPMVKLVSENVDPIYVARCSLGYNFSSFFGSPLAGLLAMGLTWQAAFSVSSTVLILMAIACFTAFHIMERRRIIQFGKYQKPKGNGGGVKLLIKHRIIKFTLISIITGVVRTTVVFWLPTYLSQYLGFASDTAAMLFTISTLLISAAAFLAIFIYERLHRNIDTVLLLSFIVAAVSFLVVYLVDHPALNIAFMIVAITSSNCAASMLWNIYCPSLRDTGMVSGATGFLDFVGYISAAVSSSLFATASTTIGWGGLIIVWFGLMIAGIAVALPLHRFKKKTA